MNKRDQRKALDCALALQRGRKVPAVDTWGGVYAYLSLHHTGCDGELRVLVNNGDDGYYAHHEPYSEEGRERWMRWINAQAIVIPNDLAAIGFSLW